MHVAARWPQSGDIFLQWGMVFRPESGYRQVFLMALSTLQLRETFKYGERGLRYTCAHCTDVADTSAAGMPAA
jgi:hypothetical protein